MKTEAEIQAEIERRVGEYECATQHPEREWNENDYKYRDCLAGVTLGREIERERVRKLIRLVQFEGLPALRQSGLNVSLSNDIQNALTKYQAARGDDHE